MSKSVHVVVGTRPEVIKLAPVIRALRVYPEIKTRVVAAEQHDQLLYAHLQERGILYDVSAVTLRGENDSLAKLTSDLMITVSKAIEGSDMVLVQGDTTTALCGALSAFYHHIPVGHVEAGLRTLNPLVPFPEEMNRRLISRLATLHFAPTERAFKSLVEDDHVTWGRNKANVFLTGNTIVDELNLILDDTAPRRGKPLRSWVPRWYDEGQDVVLVTCHRRESWGARLDALIQAVKDLSKRERVCVFWPVHPNPIVQDKVKGHLSEKKHVRIADALSYLDFIAMLYRADVVITDSGGVVEEATTLGKRTFIIRDETERPEALDHGAELVREPAMSRLAEMVGKALDSGCSSIQVGSDVFGKGDAGVRIAKHVADWLGGAT
jgi:UDP-N-acetylglucosamine 2-epimerase (non-hydrolysing)